ncbi:Spy/CpxP family protein refolding chaperone [Hydrogenophaga sp. 5NK40-0174]|uniref:Spy/CpxP family protein refolding chaperone n=1 Tax=Hydrogenophaga sp. 5NK40-0174 TaxID=3127649 RepID=UPI003103C094
MKVWIKRTLIGLASVTVLLGGLTACGAHHYREHRGPMTVEKSAEVRGKIVERVTKKLDLNADQRAKLVALGEALEAQRVAIKAQEKVSTRDAIQALVAGDKFDREAAQALVASKTEMVQTGAPSVIAALGDFYDSLNPEQQQMVRERMAKRHGRWGGWGRHGSES